MTDILISSFGQLLILGLIVSYLITNSEERMMERFDQLEEKIEDLEIKLDDIDSSLSKAEREKRNDYPDYWV